MSSSVYFFFQAEDGIRDLTVTGVQTCALPISVMERRICDATTRSWRWRRSITDRKSTRLNSSHSQISYAVFCLKKKKNEVQRPSRAEDPAELLHGIVDVLDGAQRA